MAYSITNTDGTVNINISDQAISLDGFKLAEQALSRLPMG